MTGFGVHLFLEAPSFGHLLLRLLIHPFEPILETLISDLVAVYGIDAKMVNVSRLADIDELEIVLVGEARRLLD